MSRRACLLMCALFTTSAVADDLPGYRWSRPIETPELTSTTLIRLPLDAEFFHATRDNWPDVRLVNAAGQPQPFVIRTAHDQKQRTSRQSWTAEQIAASVTEQGLQIDIHLREKEPQPTGIRLITPLRDFENQVRVETSDDGQTWEPAGSAHLIFDFSRYVDARNFLVPLPDVQRRHFRVRIAAITAEQESELLTLQRRLQGTQEAERSEHTQVQRRPFRVDRIEFYRDEPRIESGRLQLTPYPPKTFAVSHDDKSRQTIVTWDSLRQPLTEITIQTAAVNFSRAATVEVEREDSQGRRKWQPLAQGTLTRFSVGTIDREELSLNIPETQAVHYRLVIENRDSTPLEYTGLELQGPLYELMALATPQDRLTVEYGSLQAKPGQYDTAALQAALSQGQPALEVTWQAAVENIAMRDQHPAWQPWNDPRVLVAGIILLTGLMGWGLIRAGQQMQHPPGQA